MSAAKIADVTGTCVGLGLVLAIGLLSGVWALGVILGIGIGVGVADKMRQRAGLPRRQLRSPRDGNDRRR